MNSKFLLNSNGYMTKTSDLALGRRPELKFEVLVMYPLLSRRYGGVKMRDFSVTGTLYRPSTPVSVTLLNGVHFGFLSFYFHSVHVVCYFRVSMTIRRY